MERKLLSEYQETLKLDNFVWIDWKIANWRLTSLKRSSKLLRQGKSWRGKPQSWWGSYLFLIFKSWKIHDSSLIDMTILYHVVKTNRLYLFKTPCESASTASPIFYENRENIKSLWRHNRTPIRVIAFSFGQDMLKWRPEGYGKLRGDPFVTSGDIAENR